MAHFLKKLELHGFKSFAGKTVLEFPAGIVAIVGPNGSGKSNVVDALRWLLGERDAKNLRGGKVEDLIFAGTEKRARVGAASASLHFENKNKFFPVDFEEVVVGRHVSRGGDSRYFLNQSEILLRDLVDFFAKARLGSRGMIIIGQGDSDLFIRSTPLERREMIEEILGLREYQLKRTDAERRLKNSRINLDKTNALIEEILPHLRSLKRQTSRWERRDVLQEELRSLENIFFGSQLSELGEKVKKIDRLITAHQQEQEKVLTALRSAEARQASVESNQPEEKKELGAIKENIRAFVERERALQKDLGRVEAQIEMARVAPAEKLGKGGADAAELERLLDLVRKIKTELEIAIQEDPRELQAVVEAMIEEIDFTLSDRSRPRQEAEEATAVKRVAVPDGLARELSVLQKELQSLEAEIVSLRSREHSLEEHQEGFYAIFKTAVADVQQAKSALAHWENEHRERVLEKERLEFRRSEVIRQIDQAGRRPEEFSSENIPAAPPGDFAELERRIFRLRGDLASIGEIDQALMKEAQDTETRYAFLSRESKDLEKAVADLASLMQELSQKIKSEFEKSLHKINDEFDKFFGLMFGGGSAKLKVQKPKESKASGEEESSGNEEGVVSDAPSDDLPKEGGVEIELKLARKRVTSLDALSGGERSLVGIAALFAMVSVSPPPFLVLDEIDAPLDERNARRFSEMLKEFSKHTQFIVVTHNRATMEAADILYGVTLGEDGSSKIVSLKLEQE